MNTYQGFEHVRQVSEGPFPWNLPSTSTCGLSGPLKRSLDAERQDDMVERAAMSQKAMPQKAYVQGLSFEQSVRLASLRTQSEATGYIIFRHDPRCLSSGAVLKHAIKLVETYFAKFSPLIFKIGWTHDPIWRWGNSLYGYHWSKDSWTELVVLHVSHEPHGPSMLESALIEKYHSSLFEKLKLFLCCICSLGAA